MAIRALIVDDEADARNNLRLMLEEHCPQVEVVGMAASAEEARKLIGTVDPQALFLDIKMPGAVDGLEAARQILASFKTCVIMLTAYDDFRKEAEEAGVSGYVVKPVTLESLLPRVKAASDKFYAV